MVQVRQLHPQFVGEVSGVDLRLASFRAETVRELNDAINRYAVLVFHDQKLDDDALLGLGQLFGDVEPPRNHRVVPRLKHAALADISNLDASNKLRARDDHRRLDALGNQLWHSDASFREVPGALSMLFAHVVPPTGGETEFADLRAAYDALAAEPKARIESLDRRALDLPFARSARPYRLHDAERAALPNVRHKLARTHPGSKRKTLYMGSHASHIMGWPMPDGRLLLRDLMEHATQREFVHRHHWRVGDLVVWDNRCTLHRGRPYDDAKHPRDLRRVTTKDPVSPIEVREALAREARVSA